ncbi:MAG: hypothetical protein K0S41_3672 [Anaerocolumna sp.]|jgi:hypothetical protein|nr:hypothetical protein [Anaerocolumna sp.]
MFDILEIITQRLNETGYDVLYNEKKDINTSCPFVIFNIPNSSENSQSQRYDYYIEIDIWTKNLNQCIIMTDKIESLFHRYIVTNEKLQATFYVTNRINNIPDENSIVKRNQLRLEAKTYKIIA